ncbi:MAG: hypothetical protein ACK5IQ_10395 [Bacteroidales bacterium]
MTNKKTLSERDICTKFITPAIEKAGWNKQTQLLEDVLFTDYGSPIEIIKQFGSKAKYLEAVREALEVGTL